METTIYTHIHTPTHPAYGHKQNRQTNRQKKRNRNRNKNRNRHTQTQTSVCMPYFWYPFELLYQLCTTFIINMQVIHGYGICMHVDPLLPGNLRVYSSVFCKFCLYTDGFTGAQLPRSQLVSLRDLPCFSLSLFLGDFFF